MSAGTSELFCLICLLVCSCTAEEKITAEPGEDVTLPCKVPKINNISDITAGGWIRPGLVPEYVLLYRDGRFDPDNQHPSYQNRVDLQDKDMKDGNVSLILKNVMMEDTGIYMCRVSQKGKVEPFSIIYLEVLPSDHPWKTSTIVGLVVGVAVGVYILLFAAFVLVNKKLQNRKKKTSNEKQEDIERLKGNNSETENQLQQKTQDLENQVVELKRRYSQTSIELKQVKQEKEDLKNQLKQLNLPGPITEEDE